MRTVRGRGGEKKVDFPLPSDSPYSFKLSADLRLNRVLFPSNSAVPWAPGIPHFTHPSKLSQGHQTLADHKLLTTPR